MRQFYAQQLIFMSFYGHQLTPVRPSNKKKKKRKQKQQI